MSATSVFSRSALVSRVSAPLPSFLQPSVAPLSGTVTSAWGLTGVARIPGTHVETATGVSTSSSVTVPAWYAAIFANIPGKGIVQPSGENVPRETSSAGSLGAGEGESFDDGGSVGATEDEGEEADEIEVEGVAPEEVESTTRQESPAGIASGVLEGLDGHPLETGAQVKVLPTGKDASLENPVHRLDAPKSLQVDGAGGGGGGSSGGLNAGCSLGHRDDGAFDLMRPCEKCTQRANRGGGLAQIQLILAKAELTGEGSEEVRKKVQSLLETKKEATENQRKVDLKQREGRFRKVGILHVRTRACRICGVAFHNAATHARFWETVAETCSQEEKHMLERQGAENMKRQRQKNRESVRMRNTLYYFSRKLLARGKQTSQDGEGEDEGEEEALPVGDPDSVTSQSPTSSASHVPR